MQKKNPFLSLSLVHELQNANLLTDKFRLAQESMQVCFGTEFTLLQLVLIHVLKFIAVTPPPSIVPFTFSKNLAYSKARQPICDECFVAYESNMLWCQMEVFGLLRKPGKFKFTNMFMFLFHITDLLLFFVVVVPPLG